MRVHYSKLLWGLRAIIYKPFFAKIELPSYIGKPIFIEGTKKIFIGKRVRIFPHARLEAIKDGKIVFENNVYIGQNSHITSENSTIRIGEGTAVMANVCITNIDHEYRNINEPILEQEHIIKETVIGQNCFIGHGAVIQAGTILGNHCVVGANAVVRGEFPDNVVIVGMPGSIVKKYDQSTLEWERSF